MSGAGEITAARAKWDERHRRGDHTASGPSSFLTAMAARLPRQGAALDVAGGAGRHALWLAERGLDVTLVDVSPVGLALAERRASERGLALTTVARDLEEEPLPAGPWDLIVVVNYLERALFPRFAEILVPGGLLLLAHPTVRNLERHARPSRRFLLERGEAAELLAGLTILEGGEAWTEGGRHEARYLARRP
ncbi:MAG: class I SAM-dependent methyltransferase [Polyangiaceae bacterium]